MKSFKLDLSKFKRVSSDGKTTTLRSPEGHEFKIAHHALSPKNRSDLLALDGIAKDAEDKQPTPMADGGTPQKPQPKDNDYQVGEAGSPGQKFTQYMQSLVSGKAEGGGVGPETSTKERLAAMQRGATAGYGKVPQASSDEKKPDTSGFREQAPPGPETMKAAEKADEDYAAKHAEHLAEGGEVADNKPDDTSKGVTININPSNAGNIPAEFLRQQPVQDNVSKDIPAEVPSLPSPIRQMTLEQQKASLGQDAPYGTAMQESPDTAQKAPESKAPEEEAPKAEATANAPQQPAKGANDPYGTEAYAKAYETGVMEQQLGIMKEPEDLPGAQEANALQRNIAQQQKQMQDYQTHFNSLNEERQNLIKDLSNPANKIDPQRYMSSMGGWQRALTAVGLILGGIGGGLLHQENPAMQMLNANINRDIDAQKAELDKRMNLLGANLRHFGNLRDAMDMTRVQQMDIIADQLKKVAAQATNPLARDRALQLVGQLNQQTAPIMSMLAMRRTIVGQQAAGQIDPAQAIRMIVPPEHQNQATKELGMAQAMSKSRDDAMGIFDKLTHINTLVGRGTAPIQTMKQVSALRDNAAIGIARDEAGRVNEYEFNAAKQLFPSPGDDANTIATKRQNLLNMMQRKMNAPTLQMYGINPFNSGRYSPQGEKRIKLAPPVRTQ